MNDIRQSCMACNGTGHLMMWDGHHFQKQHYKPHPKLPCTVCKGYGYMRPVIAEAAPVQQDLIRHLSESELRMENNDGT